jgi:hypothetical protein
MSKEISPPEAYRSMDPDDGGMDTVLLLRFKRSGILASVFLVDRYCMGIKNAFTKTLSRAEYPDPFMDQLFPDGFAPVSCGTARNLIEGAVAYAAQFGFHPHPDFPKAFNSFKNIQAGPTDETFEYGRNGKPMFIPGPNTTPAQSRLIVERLGRICGEGNFDVFIPMNEWP